MLLCATTPFILPLYARKDALYGILSAEKRNSPQIQSPTQVIFRRTACRHTKDFGSVSFHQRINSTTHSLLVILPLGVRTDRSLPFCIGPQLALLHPAVNSVDRVTGQLAYCFRIKHIGNGVKLIKYALTEFIIKGVILFDQLLSDILIICTDAQGGFIMPFLWSRAKNRPPIQTVCVVSVIAGYRIIIPYCGQKFNWQIIIAHNPM